MVLTYFYLFIAVVLEAIATTALKLTEQFTKPVPIAVMVVCYAASFYFFTLVLKNIPLGITYALWSGLGLVLIIIIGAVRFKVPDILGIVLIYSWDCDYLSKFSKEQFCGTMRVVLEKIKVS